MKVGIIGSGNVGQALALGFEKHNYEVTIGSRTPSKLEEWKSESGFKGKTGTFSEAAAFGDLLVLAVKGNKAEEAFRLSGMDNHSNKIVLDTCNPIADAAPVNGVLQFFTDQNGSLMETLQKKFPHARFVKAFSCIGAGAMVNPSFENKPSMFICGNDAEAKKKTAEILDKFGFETEDMGTAEAARAIEPMCMLWCIPGFLRNDWNHAFRMMKG